MATIKAIKHARPFLIADIRGFEVETVAAIPDNNDLNAAMATLRLTFSASSASITTAEELQIFLDGLKKDETFIGDMFRHAIIDTIPDAWLRRLLFRQSLATYIHRLLRKCNTAEAVAQSTGIMAHNADWSHVIEELQGEGLAFTSNVVGCNRGIQFWMDHRVGRIDTLPGPELSGTQLSLSTLLKEIRLD